MSPASPDAVRLLVVDHLAGELAAFGIPPASVGEDLDLRTAGLIDSLGFLELVAALESELAIELDFEELDPASLTIVGPLCRFVAAQTAADGAASTNGAARMAGA